MNIKDIPVATKESKKSVPSIVVEGDLVRRYNAASDACKKAEEEMANIKPLLQLEGVNYVFGVRCKGDDTSSVNLVDSAENGSDCVQFSFTRKVGALDESTLKLVLAGLKRKDGEPVKLSDYAHWELQASFDAKVLMTEQNGKPKLNEALCIEMINAISNIALAHGVENPLKLSRSLVPNDDFHEKRWQDFSPAANKSLLAAFPNVMTLKSLRPKTR
jgi:hypothetical protein